VKGEHLQQYIILHSGRARLVPMEHRGIEFTVVQTTKPMDSPQRCRNQAAECLRLMRLTQSKTEADALKFISQSWVRLAGQIDRYDALIREQHRLVRK
jgi:hypothetical protein